MIQFFLTKRKNKALAVQEISDYLCGTVKFMEHIIEILGIVLPVLIIITGIIRVFVQKPIGLNSLTMLFAILLLIIGLLNYFVFTVDKNNDQVEKPVPVAVSNHSKAFNESVERVLSNYFRLTDGFINSDPVAVDAAAREVKEALDSFKIDELKADTLIYETILQPYGNTRAEINAIIEDPSMDEKRGSLNIFSNELYAILRTIRYDQATIYWKECPFAFGLDKPGNWLSKTEKTLNPYGKERCAEIRSTINFITPGSNN
jgi:hypothetical protein